MAKRGKQKEDPKQPTVELDLPLPDSGRGSRDFFIDQIDASERRRKKAIPTWRLNAETYMMEKRKLWGISENETVNVGTDFWNTEQKKSRLFYQSPDIEMTAKDGSAVGPEVTALQKYENYQLGPDEIAADMMMDEVLFDLIVTAGLGFSVIGFEEATVKKMQPTNAVQPHPTDPTAPPVPVLDPKTGEPEQAEVDQRIWSRFFWERVSPAYGMIPATWTSLRFDQAPWLGYKVPLDQDDDGDDPKPKRRSGGGGGADQDAISPKWDREFTKASRFRYVIFYRPNWIDAEAEPNPEIFYRLVLEDTKDGGEQKVVMHDCPYQKQGVNGELIAGMRGNPIHIFSLRGSGDTAYPNSDCTQGRSSSDEISTGRSQFVQQRRRNLPIRAFDKNNMSRNEISQLENGDIQMLLGVKGDPSKKLFALAQANMPMENFKFNEVAMQDNRATWGLGANAQSLAETGAKTATEIQAIQGNTEDRLMKEKNRLLTQYANGAEKLSALIQMFADEAMLVPVLGPQQTAIFKQANWQANAGRYKYRIRPDSSNRIDATEELNKCIRFYNMVARDPFFNRVPLLTKMAQLMNLTPDSVAVPQPKGPDKPNVGITIKPEQLTLPAVVELLKQYGITIDIVDPVAAIQQGASSGHAIPAPGSQAPPQAAAAPPAFIAHPGAAEQAEVLSKHEADRSGQKPGPSGIVR